MIIDLEVVREFMDKMRQQDAATYDPAANHEEIGRAIASTSGIDNQDEVADIIEEVMYSVFNEPMDPKVGILAVGHICFELGYKMGLYVSTQTD